MKINNKNFGFTLIELLIYSAVLLIAVGIVSTILISIRQSQVRLQIRSDITNDLTMAMGSISYDLAKASSIATPGAADATSSTLVFSSQGVDISYCVTDNVLRRQEVSACNSSSLAVHSSKILMNQPLFFRLENTNTKFDKKLVSLSVNLSADSAASTTLGLYDQTLESTFLLPAEQFFTCGQTIVDARDGNSYPTVLIGTQCWTADNMAYLPSVVPSATGDTTNPYYYVQGYQGEDVTLAKAQVNYTAYGVLYNHVAARTACPTGWHLPTDDEYAMLSTTLGGISVAGTKLKATSTVWDGTNISGFNAKPVGDRMIDGSFYDHSVSTYFWSDSISDPPYAWSRYLGSDFAEIFRYADDLGYGFSVRCLKD
ncbi:MAG: FISUMP domain-containing protein [Candidatus Falkowbacteria bacterium]